MYVYTNVNVFLLSIIQLFLFCICVYCAYCLLMVVQLPCCPLRAPNWSINGFCFIDLI